VLLEFPDAQALTAAVASGCVPDAIARAAARATLDEDGRLWLRPAAAVSAAVSAAVQDALRQRGVGVFPNHGAALDRGVSCWAELVPLAPAVLGSTALRGTALVQLAGRHLAEVVGEVLRCGNDRQTFSMSAGDSGHADNGHPAGTWLRVVEPPLYTLLRTSDGRSDGCGDGAADRVRGVFLEAAPRVWVAAGWSHALAAWIEPPLGGVLLIRPPARWETMTEAAFRDIRTVTRFDLPEQPMDFTPGVLPPPPSVSPRLVAGGEPRPAELWVLTEDRLGELVASWSDALVARLSLAVGETDGEAGCEAGGRRVVVLRPRIGRRLPPVLVVDGHSYAPLWGLANLLVPVGLRLEPPVRRDALRELFGLADDHVTWFEPCADRPGGFVPHSLPEAAFGPLEDWIDYRSLHEPDVPRPWQPTAPAGLALEPFICPEEERAGSVRAADEGENSRRQRPVRDPHNARPEKPKSEPARTPPARAPQLAAATDAPARSELVRRLRAAESAFRELDAPLDAPERLPLWLEMARVNAALEQPTDASICWTHLLWESDELDPDLLREWLECESATKVLDAAAGSDAPRSETLGFDIHEFDELLTAPRPSLAAAGRLAALLAWLAGSGEPCGWLAGRFGSLQVLLEQCEPALPVRTIWLAWRAFAALSGGDVLALARARDRLLERLYASGLSPDRDLPAFLRFGASSGGERYRLVGQRVLNLRGLVQTWSEANLSFCSRMTSHYIDLLFAYAAARLGETSRAHDWLRDAREELTAGDDVHAWLLAAFEYRIDQALQGHAAAGPLPTGLLEDLNLIELTGGKRGQVSRYVIDRLRQRSEILEPGEEFDPYRRLRSDDALARQLGALPDMLDRDALAGRVERLLKEHDRPAERERVLVAALELGPRLGDAFSRRLVAEVLPLLERPWPEAGRPEAGRPEAGESALTGVRLLERGLRLAGHFDFADALPVFLDRLHALLADLRGADRQAADADTLEEVEKLLGRSFQRMRRLGLRDEVARLLDRLADLAQALQTGPAPRNRFKYDPTRPLRLRLQLAAGWFDFGRDAEGWAVLNEAREALWSGRLEPKRQTLLACAYVAALGQAPAESVVGRLGELFRNLTGVKDPGSTNTHYSLAQLELVESVVRAVTGEDFAIDRAARRWLEDDEYLVRRRIHHDMRQAARSAEPFSRK
jgi:hypothetical protein